MNVRYYWHWLEEQFDSILLFVIGVALGVLLMGMRHDAIDSSFLASLQEECRAYLGPKGVLTYKDGHFGCMPGRTQ